MLRINLKNIVFIACLALVMFASGGALHAQKAKDVLSNSGLPLPRFVSLANSKTNVRAGPGQKYPIKWVLNRKSLPVEVILEFDHWRKVKDHDGQIGWVFHSLLSGKRTAITLGSDPVYAYEKPFSLDGEKTRVSIYLEPFVVVEVDECGGVWCKVSTSGYSGWVKRNLLWGVYESENID